MQLMLNLQVSSSATFETGNCIATNSTGYSIAPAFTLAPAGSTSPTEVGLRGLINAIAAPDGSFSVTAADGQGCGSRGCSSLVDGPVWQVATDAGTVYQGISGFSGLGAGIAVDMDAVLQPDGSLLAKRVAVYDAGTSNLSVEAGPIVRVDGSSPAFDSFPTEQLGPLSIDFYTLSFTNATFDISSEFSNLRGLPFPATFGAANLVSGQNVYVSTHALETEPAPIYLPATAITLIPQTINGTITAIGSEGGLTTYTVTLAPYDLFPDLAVQPGQTTLLTNPGTVVVYADGSTQMLNTNPIAVGSVLRFYGLVFNDNGALRMDCAQINDGVPE